MNKECAEQNITIRIPTPLLMKFRQKCDQNYKSMSEALRDLIQLYTNYDSNFNYEGVKIMSFLDQANKLTDFMHKNDPTTILSDNTAKIVPITKTIKKEVEALRLQMDSKINITPYSIRPPLPDGFKLIDCVAYQVFANDFIFKVEFAFAGLEKTKNKECAFLERRIAHREKGEWKELFPFNPSDVKEDFCKHVDDGISWCIEELSLKIHQEDKTNHDPQDA